MTWTPAQEAQYALNNRIDRKNLKPAVQAEYDRIAAEGDAPQPLPDTADPLARFTTRTPPEARARILAMFKKVNSKYEKPFEKDRLAWASLAGGNWEEYGQIVLQMAILDTLLSVEEKLGEISAAVRSGDNGSVGL